MKELNNKIIECTSIEQGQEIKKEFHRLGVSTMGRYFDYVDGFYGFIDNDFNAYDTWAIEWYKVTLITLDELKAIGKSEYPKKMYVGNYEN